MSRVSYNARVRVLRYAGYRDRFAGMTGTVIKYYGEGHTVGVLLDGAMNKRSSYGCYWFNPHKLELIEVIEREEEPMMLKGYTVVKVKFLDEKYDKTYNYALYPEEAAEVIDDAQLVVVKTGHHGYALAKLAGIAEAGAEVECGRQVVDVVNDTNYQYRIAKQKQLTEIKKQMDAKVKELQSNAIYEMLAEKDPELQSLLNSYKELSSGV